MASRCIPQLLQSTARRAALAPAQQRSLSSLRQAATPSTSTSSSSSIRKTAFQAAGSVAARRYAHSGEKSEYMVSTCIIFEGSSISVDVLVVVKKHASMHRWAKML
jgi:hypothetical protein